MKDSRNLMSNAKFYEGYSRYIEKESRYETWQESVQRVMDMHREYYKDKMTKELSDLIDFAEKAYVNEEVLGAQRALQFGGEQLLRHQARLYNCTSSHCDRVAFFQETMYMLLCGAGVGFSVQKHHIAKLPGIEKRVKPAKTFVVEDSIEGWSDAFGVLLSSYFTEGSFPEYKSKRVYFDLNKIRPKGAHISGGFKAPGSEPLRKSLDKIENLIEGCLRNGQDRLKPLDAYDIVMHMSDAVLSGGIRRSATICLFSPEDEEMLNSKTGNWFNDNPQRGRSNNSAVILRDKIKKKDFVKMMESVKHSGEPGYIFVENQEFTFNPCVEIGMLPVTSEGKSGFQGCNLTEINGGKCNTLSSFLKACKAASILGTLQAGYTDFKYLPKETKEIYDREALIGVSITGWMNNPEVLFNPDNMEVGAKEVKSWNKKVAKLIDINQAARTCCVKPSGNASVLLKTASGIHGEHSPRYIRHVQMNKEGEVGNLLKAINPNMVEDSVWSTNGTDHCIAFPVVSPEGSVYKKDLLGVKQLDYVKKAQQVWIEEGTNIKLCTDKALRHNVSNTITVDDWDEVTEYVYNNRKWFAGISFLAASGDKAYPQAPFTEIYTEQEIVTKYGVSALFASGLVVDGLDAFDNDLWKACSTVQGFGEDLGEICHQKMRKHDWVRRAEKFAKNYFEDDLELMSGCLKDVYNLHKWEKITNTLQGVDWISELTKKEFTDINTLGAVACSGGVCEITF